MKAEQTTRYVLSDVSIRTTQTHKPGKLLYI
jgi:hypothetical protein